MFNVSVPARGAELWQKEVKILKEKQRVNRPFLLSLSPFFPISPLLPPLELTYSFSVLISLVNKLKRMLRQSNVFWRVKCGYTTDQKLRSRLTVPARGNPGVRQQCLLRVRPRTKGSQPLPRIQHVRSVRSTPPRGASPAAGKTGPGGVQRLGLCSRCTGSAGLWPSAPGGGEPLVLWFSRRKVKCSAFSLGDSRWSRASPTCLLVIEGILGRVGDFPGSSAGKVSAHNAEDLGLIPGLGRSPGEGKGYPLQYSGLENSMDCIVHGVSKSRTRLSDFHLTFARKSWEEKKIEVKFIFVK